MDENKMSSQTNHRCENHLMGRGKSLALKIFTG